MRLQLRRSRGARLEGVAVFAAASAASLIIHGAIAAWLSARPLDARPTEVDFTITMTSGAENEPRAPSRDATFATARDGPVPRPGGRAAQVDTRRNGGRGALGGTLVPIALLPRVSEVTLQDSPHNAADVAQTQRIRSANQRASFEDRRATPNAALDDFLASGAGTIRARLPNAATDARAGAAHVAREGAARTTGAHVPPPLPVGLIPAAGPHPPETQERRRAVAGRVHGSGIASRRQGPVARGRPPVDRGPTATTSEEAGRPNDDRDAELLAARLMESFIETSRARGHGAGAGGGAARYAGREGADVHGGHGEPHARGNGDGDLGSDPRYVRWFLEQKRRIERGLIFPPDRAVQLDQGSTIVRVRVRRDGSLVSAPVLLRSSGFDDFDAAAAAAIARATPFTPIPPELAPQLDVLPVTLSLEFSNPLVR